MEVLNLYLIAPKGYEDRASVVVAETEESARIKASNHPAIRELVEAGAQLIAMDITYYMSMQGYNIQVSRKHRFH